MPVYVLRLQDGNCVVVDAANEEQARKSAKPLISCEVVSTRQLKSFVAQFALTDDGDLASTLVEKGTVADLHQHEYPMLRAAHAHSYAEFGASFTDSKAEAVLFNANASHHAQGWDKREKETVRFAVEQERLRFAN